MEATERDKSLPKVRNWTAPYKEIEEKSEIELYDIAKYGDVYFKKSVMELILKQTGFFFKKILLFVLIYIVRITCYTHGNAVHNRNLTQEYLYLFLDWHFPNSSSC